MVALPDGVTGGGESRERARGGGLLGGGKSHTEGFHDRGELGRLRHGRSTRLLERIGHELFTRGSGPGGWSGRRSLPCLLSETGLEGVQKVRARWHPKAHSCLVILPFVVSTVQGDFGPWSHHGGYEERMTFPLAPMTLGLPPAVYAAMVMLCATDREVFNIQDSQAELDVDIRVSTFYRPTHRGGFLVQVRASAWETLPFLHLAVVEHGSTGETVVAEWIAPWAQVPPPVPEAIEWPARFRESSVGAVVNHLIDRMRAHLKLTAPTLLARKASAE